MNTPFPTPQHTSPVLDWATYGALLAPFCLFVGRDRSAMQTWYILDKDLQVIFSTEKVWNKRGSNFSKEVTTAQRVFGYNKDYMEDNTFSPDTLEDGLEHIRLRYAYMKHPVVPSVGI